MAILDIIILAVIALFVFIGYKKGFFLMVMQLVALIAALLIALWASKPLATWTYDTFFDASVKETISTKVDSVDGTMTDKLDKTVASLPGIVRNAMENANVQDGEDLIKLIGLNDYAQTEEVVRTISDDVVKPLTVSVLSSFFNTILFIAVFIVLIFVVRLVNKTMELPVLKQANGTLGMVLGGLEGLLIAWAISIALFAFANALPKNGLVSHESLNKTYVVRLLGNTKTANLAELLENIKETTITTEN